MRGRIQSERYSRFSRPAVGALLRAMRLDLSYERASGDHLYYRGDTGALVEVLDLVGGYGASLFGHNHPFLREVLVSQLEEETAFNSQGSVRPLAAALGEALHDRLGGDATGGWVTTLGSTGADAVEAAIKLVTLRHRDRAAAQDELLRRHLVGLSAQVDAAHPKLTQEARATARAKLGLSGRFDRSQLFAALRRAQAEALAAPPVILACSRSFHGLTSGAVQLTAHHEYRVPFAGMGPRTRFVSDPAALSAVFEEEQRQVLWPEVDAKGRVSLVEAQLPGVGALFVEPLQGEGGVHPLSPERAAACAALTQAHGALLVLDEIQSGMGRTGTFLYADQLGITGDIVLLAKSLGGGLTKVSAMCCRRALYVEEFGRIHNSTFAEDDLSAGVALAALELVDDAFLKGCAARGQRLIDGLRALAARYPRVIREVRGAGLMVGVAFQPLRESGSPVLRMLSDQELLGYAIAGYLLYEHRIRVAPTLSQNHTLRLEPSAYLSDPDLDKALAGFEALCEVLDKESTYHLVRFVVGAEQPGDTAPVADQRRPWVRHTPQEGEARVAFIGHFIDADHMPLLDPGFAPFTRAQRQAFLDRVYAQLDPQIFHIHQVEAENGARATLLFVGWVVDSRALIGRYRAGDLAGVHRQLDRAVELAVEAGATAVGFGGYSSILTHNCEDVITDQIAVTSGNALTTAMGLEAIRQAAAEMKIRLPTGRLAAIGATGNICSVYCQVLAETVPDLTLIGRPGREERLREVAALLYQQALDAIKAGEGPLGGVAARISTLPGVHELAWTDRGGEALRARLELELGDAAPVRIATDMGALSQADLIVSSSNAPAPVIFPELLRDGPVVICDLAVPTDTHPSVLSLPNVRVVQGGLIRLPRNPGFRIDGIPLPAGVSFACVGETLLLGMTGAREHYSYGHIRREQVRHIGQVAATHGFRLAGIKEKPSF
ncbi:MAG: aminotransferase class III-fold pyridoxal phosphate-dependent enzyme [Deltaproteobacteria bacterium]|nr:aminotransferase class III-fold pyridoxal phosphate-dependent enzyme [Deltaproteobacteria bacterium]